MGQDHKRNLRVDFLQKSFDDVKTQMLTQYNYNPSSKEVKIFASLHKRIFCLCSLIYELSKSDKERMLFLTELHSDLILLLIVGPLRIKKAISLAIRSSIEDTLRHVYYKDHPIELSLLNESDDNRMTDKEFFKYVEIHPLYRDRSSFNKLLHSVHNIYHTHSKQLHSASLSYFSSLKVISDISGNSDILEESIKDIVSLSSALLTIIIIFHSKEFRKMSFDKRKLFLSCLKNEHKKIIHDL